MSDLITVDPDILGGTPVFKGTRVPVKTLFEYLEGGASIDEFLADFPSVHREQVLRLLEQLKRDGPQNPQDHTALKRQAVVGADHLPLGVAANRSSLEYLVQHAYDQKLTPRKFSVEEIFAPGTLDFV